MGSVANPRSVSTNLVRAEQDGIYRNAGQNLLSDLSSLYGLQFDESAAEINGNSSEFNAYALSTFCGWGSFVGVRNNFDTLRITAYPFDANDLPRFALVRVRLGAYDAAPEISVVIPLRNVAVDKPLPIIAELGSVIANAGNADVWVDVMCDGKIGIDLSDTAVSGTGTDVLRYITDQALTLTEMSNTVVGAASQILCRTFLTGSENPFAIGIQYPAIYDAGTFVGWNNVISTLPGEFNVIEIPIYAYDANVLPTQVRIRFRQTTYNGTVLATAVAEVHYDDVGYYLATFVFDSDITLSGTVWLEVIANGRIAFTIASVNSTSTERYRADGVARPGIDGVAQTLGSVSGYQWWFKSILRDRSIGKGFTASILDRFIHEKTNVTASTAFSPTCSLSLPPFVNCIETVETNIYWDGIFNSWIRPEQYTIRVNCGIGRHDDYRWRIVPSTSGYQYAAGTDIGTTAMTIEAYFNGVLIDSATTSLRVKADSAGNGVTRKCLVIGDSTTEGGEATQQILDQVTASSGTYAVTLIGTKGSGPNFHEGYSGKNYDWLRTNDVANPFYNAGDFDFSYYLSNNGLSMSSGDSVFLLMGINPPIFGQATDDAANTEILGIKEDIAAIIASIQSAVAGIKVWIGLVIPPSHDQSAFGANYQGNSQYRDRYNRNIGLLRDSILTTYSASEGDGILLAPVNCCLDTRNNMQTTTEQLNAQNATTHNIQSNGVHPAASGYKQIGDMLYCCLKGLEN